MLKLIYIICSWLFIHDFVDDSNPIDVFMVLFTANHAFKHAKLRKAFVCLDDEIYFYALN